MKRLPNMQKSFCVLAVVLAALICGCSDDTKKDASSDSDTHAEGQGEHERGHGESGDEGRGEHDRGGGEHQGEEGEESGTELALDETYDETRHGARLVLKYDAESNSFNGTVENTTKEKLERVRVEVHLSNGKELGPTTPDDLGAGEKRDIKLTATGKDFDGWNAHPEVGSNEHGHGGKEGGEGGEGGEHGGEGLGEHDRDGDEHK